MLSNTNGNKSKAKGILFSHTFPKIGCSWIRFSDDFISWIIPGKKIWKLTLYDFNANKKEVIGFANYIDPIFMLVYDLKVIDCIL